MIFGQPNFNQFCLGVSLVVWLFVGSQDSVCAHEYEDGFVERSLTITIRDGVGYGEYQIGLNAKTAAQVLRLAEQKQKEAMLQQTKNSEVAPSVLLAPVKSPQLATGDETDAVSNLPAETLPEAAAPLQVGEHLTDLATIKRFGELQQHWFKGRLNLTSDGLPVELSKVSIEPAARHPYSVLVKFQFLLVSKIAKKETTRDLPSAQAPAVTDTKSEPSSRRIVDFRVADQLFSGCHGATRYALRARGATMLLQSNVAPVLVRADRVAVTRDATAIQEAETVVIQARLAVGGR